MSKLTNNIKNYTGKIVSFNNTNIKAIIITIVVAQNGYYFIYYDIFFRY